MAVIRPLVEAGADVNITRWDDNTPLIDAAQCQQPAAAALLLQLGAKPNHVSRFGTALHQAIVIHNIECARVLVPASDLSTPCPGGRTALHACVRVANQEAFDLILPLVADVNARSVPGVQFQTGEPERVTELTALHYACQLGCLDMVKALL